LSAFFDTNILVYAQQANGKADRARALLAGGGKLSVQVLNEFTAVSRRKQRREWREISEAIVDVLAVVDTPLALTLELHAAARAFVEDHRLSFYDALIVAAALEAGCDTLFTEDMQHGRKFGGLTIVNPFLET
jgi:predicted nucleic acid-binding protein